MHTLTVGTVSVRYGLLLDWASACMAGSGHVVRELWGGRARHDSQTVSHSCIRRMQTVQYSTKEVIGADS